jgi:uncharacterized damage-inducible protein DinB
MRADDVRFLFAFDRWATRRILAVADGIDEETWSKSNAIGERGLGGILIHALGAHQRYRNDWQRTGQRPRPEAEPLPTVTKLSALWEREWQAMDAYLRTVNSGNLLELIDGIPAWQMHVNLLNHGTQHRSEAAVLLTAADRSPGDLDLIVYAEQQRA